MLKYARIENEETKVVSVGTGTNTSFYESIGMELMDVEQSDIDGQWYVAGYAPKKTEEQKQKEAEEALQKHYTDLIQHLLDVEAQKLGYDSCLSVCSYIDTGVSKFDAEGKQFRAWRSAIWKCGYELLDEVKEGKRAVPTPEELPNLLPKLTDFEEVSV